MKVLVDLNVMIDFLQRRQPFYEDAANVMDLILFGKVRGVLPSHAITTLYYFLSKGSEKSKAIETIRWITEVFELAACDKQVLRSALDLDMEDFEDAVTSQSAANAKCAFIVTRNVQDFTKSAVPAVTPSNFLLSFDRK